MPILSDLLNYQLTKDAVNNAPPGSTVVMAGRRRRGGLLTTAAANAIISDPNDRQIFNASRGYGGYYSRRAGPVAFTTPAQPLRPRSAGPYGTPYGAQEPAWDEYGNQVSYYDPRDYPYPPQGPPAGSYNQSPPPPRSRAWTPNQPEDPHYVPYDQPSNGRDASMPRSRGPEASSSRKRLTKRQEVEASSDEEDYQPSPGPPPAYTAGRNEQQWRKDGRTKD